MEGSEDVAHGRSMGSLRGSVRDIAMLSVGENTAASRTQLRPGESAGNLVAKAPAKKPLPKLKPVVVGPVDEISRILQKKSLTPRERVMVKIHTLKTNVAEMKQFETRVQSIEEKRRADRMKTNIIQRNIKEQSMLSPRVVLEKRAETAAKYRTKLEEVRFRFKSNLAEQQARAVQSVMDHRNEMEAMRAKHLGRPLPAPFDPYLEEHSMVRKSARKSKSAPAGSAMQPGEFDAPADGSGLGPDGSPDRPVGGEEFVIPEEGEEPAEIELDMGGEALPEGSSVPPAEGSGATVETPPVEVVASPEPAAAE